jgi:glutaredoxin 3
MRSILKKLFGRSDSSRSGDRSNMYQPKQVRLFIKSFCPWCSKAMNWLEDHDIRYEILDVVRNDSAYQEMLKLSGQTLAPVIEVDGRVLADFGPSELSAFWKELGENPPAHD